jgi:hypothetical protein
MAHASEQGAAASTAGHQLAGDSNNTEAQCCLWYEAAELQDAVLLVHRTVHETTLSDSCCSNGQPCTPGQLLCSRKT